MKKFFKYIKADRLLFWSFVISIILLLVSMILIGIFFSHLPPFLPLFNSLPWGYMRVGPKIAFFLPVLIAWLLVLINSILCSILYEKVVLLARFIGGTTIAICGIVFIFTVQILFLIH
jgi:hypothetical protein